MTKGNKQLNSGNNQNNTLNFLIQQSLSKINTSIVVEVVGVSGDYVNVRPLVNLLDGDEKGVEHNIINKIPYFTYQCGTNAVKITPEVGDFGLCVICKNDISTVKNSKKTSNPNSNRKFSLSDGLYIGSFIKKKEATNYIEIKDDSITIEGTGEVNINCNIANINASSEANILSPLVNVECGNADVTATIGATITSPSVNLGGAGGVGIARLNDTVDLNPVSPTYAKIITASTIVKGL